MCGIVGIIGREQRAMDVLLDGLESLEYRGYDSAGVAILNESGIELRRAVGKLRNLRSSLDDAPIEGCVGIGHTRWATHGKPSEHNAHPHRAGSVVLVHNGIIENYRELRAELEAAGRVIASDPDTELIAHCIDEEVQRGADLLSASRAACRRLTGSYAFGVVCAREPGKIVAARLASPLVVALGDGENFAASDIPAVLSHTRDVIFLDDGETAVLSQAEARQLDLRPVRGRPVDRDFRTRIQWDPISAARRAGLQALHAQGDSSSNRVQARGHVPRTRLATRGRRYCDLDGIEFPARPSS